MGRWGGCHSVPLPDLAWTQVSDVTGSVGYLVGSFCGILIIKHKHMEHDSHIR